MPVVLVARYKVKPGNRPKVDEALHKMMALVKEREPACLQYQPHVSTEDPNAMLLYEVYQDQAALDAHGQTAYFKEHVLGTVVPLLASREREFYTPLQSAKEPHTPR